jgi:hypothetical protein
MPEEESNFIVFAKKAIRWLFVMSQYSVASRRAWQLCDISLRRLSIGMKFDISDMPSYPYQNAPASTVSLENPHDFAQEIPPSTSGLWNPQLEDLSLVNQEPSEYGVDHHYNNSGYPDMQSTDLMSSFTGDAQMTDDLYFPYDPISGEFIRSFFPYSNEDLNWDQI